MRYWMGCVLLGAAVASLALLAAVDPAFAQCFPRGACASPEPAPGPLIGVGLPLAGAVVAALLVVRHFRHKA
jgi:hypothetical protein